MAGMNEGQYVATVAQGSATTAATPARTGAFTLRAGSSNPSDASLPSPLTPLNPVQLAFPSAETEVAWGAADDAAAANEAAEERHKQVEEELRNMKAMVQELARDLGTERAARTELARDLGTERAARAQLQKII